MSVTETFFTLEVADMERAKRFYAAAFGASISATMHGFTSTYVAGVRIGLFTGKGGGPTGLHFAVKDLDAALAAVVKAGGRAGKKMTAAPGVHLAEAWDTEGNALTLRGP